MANFNRYDTVLNNVRAVAGLVGLERPNVAVASTETEIVQLVEMLNAKGRELCDEHSWQQFERKGTVTIGPGIDNGVLLPDDWGGFISRTGWNETGETRLVGPNDAATWQRITVTSFLGDTINLRYRVRGSQLLFETYPEVATTISFEYYSRGGVQHFDIDVPTFRDFCENDSDIVLFDSLLIQYAVRMLWLETKGFDTAAASKDYLRRFNAVRSKDKDAPVLTLHRRAGVRLINASNTPETGFGS